MGRPTLADFNIKVLGGRQASAICNPQSAIRLGGVTTLADFNIKVFGVLPGIGNRQSDYGAALAARFGARATGRIS